MTNELHDDVVDLQTRLAFQEQTIEVLDSTIIDQQKQIDALVRELNELKTRVERQEQQGDDEAAPFDPSAERPPHY